MINLHCFCFGILGVQQHGRYYASLLREFEEIALFPWDDVPAHELLPPFVVTALEKAADDTENNPGIGIGILNRMSLVSGSFRVASTVWETSRIPEQELAHLEGIDQVWIPSQWGRSVLVDNGIDSDRIRVIPEGVDTARFFPAPHDTSCTDSRPFRFLCVGKWEQRKGIDILLRAWCQAFLPHENVELALHCHNPHLPNFQLEKALDALKLPPHAPILPSHPCHDHRMGDVYRNSDAFVLPTRGEGWGLPVIEAMACGLPVVVTNYSAPLEYANSTNAFLIDVEQMVPVNDHHHFDADTDFGKWAQPDREHLAQLLRYVYENREEASHRGQQAARDASENWTWRQSVSRGWHTLDAALRAQGLR